MSLTVAIIAGGRSRRFGSPKALAQFDGKRLIDHALELSSQLSEHVLISCGQAPLPLVGDVHQLPDSVPDCGPIGGLLSVLEACETEWLAIMPCDMPLLRVEIYEKLLRHRKEKHGVVAASGIGIQPLVSVLPVASQNKIFEQIRCQKYSMRALLEEIESIEVPFFSDTFAASFQNVNTVQELEEILKNEA